MHSHLVIVLFVSPVYVLLRNEFKALGVLHEDLPEHHHRPIDLIPDHRFIRGFDHLALVEMVGIYLLCSPRFDLTVNVEQPQCVLECLVSFVGISLSVWSLPLVAFDTELPLEILFEVEVFVFLLCQPLFQHRVINLQEAVLVDIRRDVLEKVSFVPEVVPPVE